MQKIWIKITLIIIIISIFSMEDFGESAEFQTWSDIATIYKFSDNWRYDGDQGIRGVLSQNDFTLLYFRPSVRYRARSWFTLHGGSDFLRLLLTMGMIPSKSDPGRVFDSSGP